MVIKRKDGSIYRLQGPNKLMMSQDFWINNERVRIHNMEQLSKNHQNLESAPAVKQAPVIVEAPTVPYKEPVVVTEEKSIDLNYLLAEINKLSNPTPIEQKEVVKETPKTVEPKQGSVFRKLERSVVYCLPAKESEHFDSLYDDSIRRLEYEKPFKFQAAQIGNTDLKAAYWTTIDKITIKSIIFHPDQYRWWVVQKIMNDPSKDGFVLECLPSSIKPDFTS